ncbi:MAG TPA: N-acetylmuramoyl-L-alanine amidase [Gemmatimonadaceae bacterium]|nr:N-acetylmuramoyl-L-alanine amidase [Gemmatimonadaceae bacterium]
MRWIISCAALMAAACAGRGGAGVLSPDGPALPPVPLVEGPLAPRVTYPSSGALITSRDSNFIFGSVGNGRATLSINGTPVPVLPNGSFIAFLPNPPASAPQYELVVTAGAQSARLTHVVRVLPPRPAMSLVGPLGVDSASVVPRGSLVMRDDELVRVGVRAPPNVSAWVRVDSVLVPLVNDAARPGPSVGASIGATDSAATRFIGNPELWSTDVRAADLRNGGQLVIARGVDTARFTLPAVAAPFARTPRWGLLGADSVAAVSDTDRVIVGRPTPGGTYKWFLLPGTQLEITGRIDNFVRVRLDDALEAWVNATDVRALPDGFAAPRRTARNARLVPADDWVDLVIPIGERPAYFVEEAEQAIVLTLYDTQSDTDIITYGGGDPFVRVVSWEQQASGRVRYTLRLSQAPFGYLAMWQPGAFVLRVRRPPRIDSDRPLAGITIAVDAGHPGAPGESAGATGPTGLREPDATLAISARTKELLEARGATVVMIRATPAAVPLGQRPVMARRANAHALVSVHLNALPDGVNPFTAHGTGTYFFHPHAEPLARAVQDGMVRRMGLRNLGVYYDNLAIPRTTWMPSILCEGAFIMIPEHEAALRTSEFQQAYAAGIADGVEAYFRSLAGSR